MEEALESRSVIQALYLCLMTSPVVIANRGVKGAYIDTWQQRRRLASFEMERHERNAARALESKYNSA
jgi:hypothetical protein